MVRTSLLLPLAVALACAALPYPERAQPPRLGREPWPDLARGGAGQRDGRGDAALILSVEDYQHLPDRPHAHEVAGAWARYLREVRGLRRLRIHWLRDGDVSREKIRDRIARARFAITRDARLWVIFVGHLGSHPQLPHGILLGPDARGRFEDARDNLRVAELLTQSGYGKHDELVAVLDGCLPGVAGPDVWDAGAPARPLPNLNLPPLRPPSPPPMRDHVSGQALIFQMLREVFEWNAHDAERSRREPTDAATFTAGLGDRCVATLPGTDYPALSYLLLGALRGWGAPDGRVTAVGALAVADRLLRGAGSRARLEAFGADLVLTRGAEDPGPSPAGVRPPRTLVPDLPNMPEETAVFGREDVLRIPRGRFTFGCRGRWDVDCEPDERPPRRIGLLAFAIDTYEVTWRDYASCVAAGACRPVDPADCYAWDGQGFARGAALPAEFLAPDHPVVCVDWGQAAEYCSWLGKRLPTEAEWERAARGPSARTEFPWGDERPTCERARFGGCGDATAAVGAHPAGRSPEGVHDLAGNAAEWVADWYAKDALFTAARNNPTGPTRGFLRVVRGGSFYEGPGHLRSSYRYGLNPVSGFGFVGFRCAR